MDLRITGRSNLMKFPDLSREVFEHGMTTQPSRLSGVLSNTSGLPSSTAASADTPSKVRNMMRGIKTGLVQDVQRILKALAEKGEAALDSEGYSVIRTRGARKLELINEDFISFAFCRVVMALINKDEKYAKHNRVITRQCYHDTILSTISKSVSTVTLNDGTPWRGSVGAVSFCDY